MPAGPFSTIAQGLAMAGPGRVRPTPWLRPGAQGMGAASLRLILFQASDPEADNLPAAAAAYANGLKSGAPALQSP